jgi:lipopolysaccharide/colanic/teichoic acid biosynthesis glycosyltransferase
MYGRFGKRLLDVVVSIAGLTVLSPVIAFTALVVRIGLGSPILFRQVRPGQDGRSFTIIKFRTMRGGVPGESDGARLSTLGTLLRSLSLDELPELVNVLRGDMSLVGPRPLLMDYLDRYTAEQARRHEVKPGITGWAQIHGRNELTWEDKFRYDVWYVDHLSFGLDMRILAATIGTITRRDGITAPGHATADTFMGSRPS